MWPVFEGSVGFGVMSIHLPVEQRASVTVRRESSWYQHHVVSFNEAHDFVTTVRNAIFFVIVLYLLPSKTYSNY